MKTYIYYYATLIVILLLAFYVWQHQIGDLTKNPRAMPEDLANVTIPRVDYEQLKKDSESLSQQMKHNEHMATSSTDAIKENIDLKSQIAACNADKDTKHIKELLTVQDNQITTFRNENTELKNRLKNCK